MESLKKCFRCSGIELVTKYNMYMAIPVNTALWGCASWSMPEKMRRRIRAFHHQSVRSIVRIKMHIVETYRIKNSPMVLQYPVHNWHREEETTGLDRKGDLDGRDENPTTTTHLLDEYNPRTSPRNTYALQSIHEMPNTPLAATSRKALQKHGRHKQKTKRLPQNFPARGGNRTPYPNRKQPWN